jgi:hypothetical protein
MNSQPVESAAEAGELRVSRNSNLLTPGERNKTRSLVTVRAYRAYMVPV